MDIATLNKIAQGPFLPRKSLSDLEDGRRYTVTVLKQLSTKYGLTIIVELDGDFQMFLPKYVSSAIVKNPNIFDELNAKITKCNLFLLYKGDNKFEFLCD